MDKNLSINITSGTIIKSILLVLLFVVLFLLKDLVLVLLMAVVIASSVEPATKWFTCHKVPRLLAVILIYLALAVVIAGLFLLIVPPVLDEASGLLATSPKYFDSINLWGPFSGISNFSIQELIGEFRNSITGATGSVLQTISVIFGGALNFVLIIVLSFYLAVQEYGIANFLKIITPIKQEKYIIGLWDRTRYKIGLWMQGQILLAFFIGVLVYLGLTILKIKYAFLLALLAAILELIPLFGPVIAAIPAIAIGFADGGATLGFLVVGFYIIIQQFENHLIYPLVVKKVIGVPPLLVIIALIVGAKLAGFFGIILSVPLATALMEYINDMEEDKKKLIKQNV